MWEGSLDARALACDRSPYLPRFALLPCAVGLLDPEKVFMAALPRASALYG